MSAARSTSRPTGSISLSRALRLARRPSVGDPASAVRARALARLGDRLGVGRLWGDGVRLLRYGRGVDNTRMLEEIGYEPAFDAEGAVRDFAARAPRPQGRPHPPSRGRSSTGSPGADA